MNSIQLSHTHLLPEVAQTMSWSLDKRIAQVWSDSFISYPASEKITFKIDQIRRRPRSIRPQNLLITGYPGTGKTAILNEVYRRNPEVNTPDFIRKPVIFAETPAGAGEGRLLGAILRALGYHSDWDRGSIDSKTRKVLNALQKCQVELLMIDEVNNLLGGGKKTWEALRTLKEISNQLRIPIVFAGTEDAAVVLEEDSQLTSRIDVTRLRTWEYCKEFAKLLYDVESTIPLARPSRLYSKEMALEILKLSSSLNPQNRKGVLFDILKLVRSSAEYELRNGSEIISFETLKLMASDMASDWSAR